MITKNIFSTGAQKLFLYPERIDNWQNGKPIVPITLEIQPSERCNHHCPHCQGKFALDRLDALNRSRNGALLDLTLLETIWELPPEGIVISGNTGDPLMHPKIDKLFVELSDHSIPTVLITNGQLLNQYLADLIVQICRGVRVSVDACDDHTFALTHGVRNAWQSLLNNISALVEAKRHYAKSLCHIGIGFLTSALSKPWMLQATVLAKSLGVDYIQFRPYHYDTTNVIDTLKECEELESGNFKVYSSYQKYSRLGDCFDRSFTSCQAAWFYTVLDARGDLYICCHNVGNKDAKVGSLKDGTWKEFISSKLRRDVIQGFTTGQCIPNCRLHTQNEMLMELSKNPQIAPLVVSTEIMQHAPFL